MTTANDHPLHLFSHANTAWGLVQVGFFFLTLGTEQVRRIGKFLGFHPFFFFTKLLFTDAV